MKAKRSSLTAKERRHIKQSVEGTDPMVLAEAEDAYAAAIAELEQ